MEDVTWKSRKELFISGLNGTSVYEITVISGLSPALILLRALVLSYLPTSSMHNIFLRYLLDYILLIVPIILIVTEFSDNATIVFFTIVVLQGSVFSLLWTKKPSLNKSMLKKDKACYISPNFYQSVVGNKAESMGLDNIKQNQNTKKKSNGSSVMVMSSKLPFIMSFRAYVNIATCICILAVDFHIFPRRLAKVESFGSGLLDLGVGGFIMSNAIISREARKRTSAENANFSQLTLSAALFQMLSTWPIVVLGVLRLISIKMSGYNEHVTEYGVHWNFFFTLALVKILATVLLLCFKAKHCLWMSISIAMSYQFVLSHPSFDLTTLIFNDERAGVLMANKEGISSCFGFLSLYFAGVYLGQFLFSSRNTISAWKRAAVKLLIAGIVFLVLLMLSETFIQPISRRLANLSYLLWLLAHCTLFLFGFLIVDIIVTISIEREILPMHSMPDRWLILPQKETDSNIKVDYSPPSPPLCLIHAINRNQLFYFLFSNLLTGLINAVVDTMTVNNSQALLILCLYNFIVTFVLWLLNIRRITLKFW